MFEGAQTGAVYVDCYLYYQLNWYELGDHVIDVMETTPSGICQEIVPLHWANPI